MLIKKKRRNSKGLKNNCRYAQLGQILDKSYKKTKKKSQLPLLKSWEQKQGVQEQKQGTAHAPCPQHHLRGGQKTSATPPARPLDTPLPSPHIRNPLTSHSGSEQARETVNCSRFPCCRSPSKALPEFPVWPLINFY